MKKIYNAPECEMEKFGSQDVVTMSGFTDGKDDWGYSPEW